MLLFIGSDVLFMFIMNIPFWSNMTGKKSVGKKISTEFVSLFIQLRVPTVLIIGQPDISFFMVFSCVLVWLPLFEGLPF